MKNVSQLLAGLPELPSDWSRNFGILRAQKHCWLLERTASLLSRKVGPLGGDLGPRLTLSDQMEMTKVIVATHGEFLEQLAEKFLEHRSALLEICDAATFTDDVAKRILFDGLTWFREASDGVWLDTTGLLWSNEFDQDVINPPISFIPLQMALVDRLDVTVRSLPIRILSAQLKVEREPADRRAALKRFIEVESERRQKRVRQIDICKMLRYRDASELRRYIRHDPKTSKVAIERFDALFLKKTL